MALCLTEFCLCGAISDMVLSAWRCLTGFCLCGAMSDRVLSVWCYV